MTRLRPLSTLTGATGGRRMQLFAKQGRFGEALALVAECAQIQPAGNALHMARNLLDYLCATPIPKAHQAGMAQHADALVQGLVDIGVDANRMAFAGVDTALSLAVSQDNLPLVQALLAHGADPNLLGSRDDRPCLAQMEHDNPQMVRALIDHGANIHTQAGWDGPMLWHAAAKGQTQTMAVLVEAGADLHFVDETGNNLVHHLVERMVARDMDAMAGTLQLAVLWGVNIEARNYAGKTPLDLADELAERGRAMDIIDAARALLQAQRLDHSTHAMEAGRPRSRL